MLSDCGYKDRYDRETDGLALICIASQPFSHAWLSSKVFEVIGSEQKLHELEALLFEVPKSMIYA